jgi:hypothetical protein
VRRATQAPGPLDVAAVNAWSTHRPGIRCFPDLCFRSGTDGLTRANAYLRLPVSICPGPMPRTGICRCRRRWDELGTNGTGVEPRALTAVLQCCATLLHHADPLLLVKPEVAAGDYGAASVSSSSARRISVAARRVAARICARVGVERHAAGRVRVGDVKPLPRSTNSMPSDLRVPASAASSISGASVWAGSAMWSKERMSERRPSERDTRRSV